MRGCITQFEAQLTVTLPSPKDSGFQTPREVPVVNKFIDLDTPPRPRIPKEKIDANEFRSRMMMPPVLSGPFEQHREEPDDVPRTTGEWLPRALNVNSLPGLANFVMFNDG